MTNKKKGRARSPEKKKKQFERILEEGEKLFLKFGQKGFNMRALAKKLGVSQANLYNYVNSKRELWFAIRKKKIQQYLDMKNKAIKQYKNSLVDLTEKWGEFFLEFAAEDFRRFELIWNIPPPHAKKIGPIERAYIRSTLPDSSLDDIKKAFQAEGLEQDEVSEYFFFMTCIFYGAAVIERFLQIRNRELKGKPSDLSIEKFRKYVLKKLRYNAEANFQ